MIERITLRRIPGAILRRLRTAVPRRPRPAILMYHRIARERFDPWGLAVSPARFADQLGWLAANRIVLPLTDFATRHAEGTLPDRAVAITFDDGYACNAATAAPLLEAHRMPATLFLPAQLIERGAMFWWDELRDLVMEHPHTALELRGQTVEIAPQSPSDSNWPDDDDKRTARQRAFLSLWSTLRTFPAGQLEEAMTELRAQCAPPAPDGSRRLMSVDEVRAIGSEMIEFGSHGMTHASLTALPPVERRREIEKSMAACRDLAGENPRAFAYPFGDYDPQCESLVERAGFVCGCTTERRSVEPGTRPFALPRIQVANWSPGTLRLMISSIN